MKPILLGMTCYGRHIDTFLKWTWPSLMAPGNLPSFCKERFIKINIHTDLAGKALLIKDIPMPYGVEFTINVDVTKEDKYVQLGRHQNEDLREARARGADYHCLMPDYIYSENCFSGISELIKRGYKAISRLVMSVTQEDVCPLLEQYRYDGVLLIPHIILATQGVLNIHLGCRQWLSSPDSYAASHVRVYETKTILQMHSPHQTPVYVAANAIELPENNLPLDGQLDKVSHCDWYAPQPWDCIGIIEITPRLGRTENDSRINLAEFARIFRRNTIHSKQQWALFNNPTIDPLNRAMMPAGHWIWKKEDIDNAQHLINDELIKVFRC